LSTIPREILRDFCEFEIPPNLRLIPCLALGLIVGSFGCSTTVKHPADLPVRYHDAKYDFTFFLPADWKGYSVLAREWRADLHSTDYQTVVGKEHGPIILLRHPRWKADKPYQDIPILAFTRSQWNAVIPQRLFVGAGGIMDEVSYNDNYVFGINSRHNWGELEDWEETGEIVRQNATIGMPHLHENP
jgi:hypothetical protein